MPIDTSFFWQARHLNAVYGTECGTVKIAAPIVVFRAESVKVPGDINTVDKVYEHKEEGHWRLVDIGSPERKDSIWDFGESRGGEAQYPTRKVYQNDVYSVNKISFAILILTAVPC